ncbi:MAG: anthranilate synthase component I family protein [Pseudomonadota bacterium]
MADLIVREVQWCEPEDCFRPIASQPYGFLLNGGRRAEERDWSFLLAWPDERIEGYCAATRADRFGGTCVYRAFDRIETSLAAEARAPVEFDGLQIPFASGFVGFVGYEVGGALEPKGEGPETLYPLPDMALGRFAGCIAFYHPDQRAFVLAPDKSALQSKLSDLVEIGSAERKRAIPPVYVPKSVAFIGSTRKKCVHQESIRGIQEAIRRGAVFQANISHRLQFQCPEKFDPFALAMDLLQPGTANYGAFLSFLGGTVISNSPERFFKITADTKKRRILADPIKGTRPRLSDPSADSKMIDELRNDPKDRAENVMIADLTRNDLSRFCRDGTLNEDFICEVRSLSHVHHLVSRISGEIRDDVSTVGAFKMMFPCGSITGAPKIEAMKLIGAVEEEGRGPYCGAIGYFDDSGGADFSVAIRTAIYNPSKNHLSYAVGGGITLRSDPVDEYTETLNKAKALLDALGISLTEEGRLA